jgi:hypothetical protein
MARLRRRILLILGGVVVAIAALLVSMWLFLKTTYTPSTIVDFHPSNFQAKADKAFFYSIGDELKHSDELDPAAPTLLRGQIENFLVSPDGAMIAVVANGRLIVVGTGVPATRQVAPVDSIYRDPKPLGQYFYRDDGFQWSRDSRSLYLIRDEYYESKGSQLFSGKGELWRYDLQSGSLQLVLKPFSAYTCFLGRNSGIYYSVPTDSGDLRLEYFDGSRVTDIGPPNASAIAPDRLSTSFVESPFFSFSISDNPDIAFPQEPVAFVMDQQDGPERLEIAGKPYLTVARGEGFKGPSYCIDTLRSVLLPGGRYFLFNVPYCGNYNGQLLIDTLTGNYERLPPDTRVYLTMNTDTDPYFRITGGGMVAK